MGEDVDSNLAETVTEKQKGLGSPGHASPYPVTSNLKHTLPLSTSTLSPLYLPTVPLPSTSLSSQVFLGLEV